MAHWARVHPIEVSLAATPGRRRLPKTAEGLTIFICFELGEARGYPATARLVERGLFSFTIRRFTLAHCQAELNLPLLAQ